MNESFDTSHTGTANSATPWLRDSFTMAGSSFQCPSCGRPPAAVFLDSAVALSDRYSTHFVCSEKYRRRKKPLTQGVELKALTANSVINGQLGEPTSTSKSLYHVTASSDAINSDILLSTHPHVPRTVSVKEEGVAGGDQAEATWHPQAEYSPHQAMEETRGHHCTGSVEGELKRGEGEEGSMDVEVDVEVEVEVDGGRGRKRGKRKRGKKRQRDGGEGGEAGVGTRRAEPASAAEQRAAARHEVRAPGCGNQQHDLTHVSTAP